MSDARPLLGVPWVISTDADVEELETYLLSTARTVPVIAVSEDYSGECVVDPDWLARKLQGFGTVVRLSFPGARAWTTRVGQPWSVYLGAVRTYNPGLRWNDHSPLSHPRALPDSILAWVNGTLTGSRAFSKYLVYMAARHAAYRRINWEPLLFMSEARREASHIAVLQSSNDAELVTTLKAQVQELQEDLAKKDKEFENWFQEHERLDEQCERLTQENGQMSFALDSLRMQLAEKLGADPDNQIPPPVDYGDLPDWVVLHFSGRLLLSPRALQGLKDAVYEKFDLVWKGLAALAHEYRDLRLGAKENSNELWEAKLVNLGLECENAVSETSRGKYADEYEIFDPFGSGKKRAFERDLKKGNSREARHCLRIYFYWDDEHRQVVIGWLPSHLTITTT
ncbi:hypothetical protein IT570_03645 [Candidatus Sumerlaeota bacterium]|nr:hypothetical protein [Candidatus Sumerlaeota bacterium]